jgi:hypothetical protein
MGLHVVAIIAVDQQLYTGVLALADQITIAGMEVSCNFAAASRERVRPSLIRRC